MIRGAVFDLDGVLLDSMAVWNDLGARYLLKQGIQPQSGLRDILFSMSMEQGAEYMKEQYLLNKTSKEILDGIQEMLQDFYFYEVRAKEGAKELLNFLHEKGIPMTAATSSPREHVTRALKRNGLYDFLKKVDTTSEVGESKHSPLIYRLAAESMGTKRVVIRTADIGGEKAVDCMEILGENNPVMGYRGIRVSLDKEEMFKTQLRAILRASVYGNLAIMFPMISSIEEAIAAKNVRPGSVRRAAVAHCNCEERGLLVAEEMKRLLLIPEILVVPAAGVTSMYANDGGVVLVV